MELLKKNYIPYARHYNPRFVYFFTPFFSARAVNITDYWILLENPHLKGKFSEMWQWKKIEVELPVDENKTTRFSEEIFKRIHPV